MPSDKPFLSFVVDEETLKALDEYRFENRFNSRAEAIRFLLLYALKDNPTPPQKEE